jgi:hypothetical protein
MPTQDKHGHLNGKQCQRDRYIDQQCDVGVPNEDGVRPHHRSIEELRSIQDEYCATHNIELPERLHLDTATLNIDTIAEQEALWLDEFLRLGGTLGAQRRAAENIGIPVEYAENFGVRAKRHLQPKIDEFYKSQGVLREQALALLGEKALGIGPYLLWAEERDEPRYNKNGEQYAYRVPAHFEIDGEALLRDGKGHLVQGLGESQRGTQTIRFADGLGAISLIADIAGWKSATLNVKDKTTEELQEIALGYANRVKQVNADSS